MLNFKEHIREIPDWPQKGVNFKDITPLLQNADVFKALIDELVKPYEAMEIDKIVVIDARGFLLGTAMAYKLGCGISLVRKKGRLPYKTIEESYQKEYGPDILTMHEDAVLPGEKVLIVDDLLATGGTMQATVNMVEKLGGEIVGISVIVDLPFLGGSKKFPKYTFKSLITYLSE
ncbi:MAG: Adenine phosphoribosyltransferase [Parcubacteria group bacterium GW2011_GWA2_40_23]|nr:MAG: Adenine phosphoribosyltransferase [Parcubacteria group bacterium GW2011_GWA2_40_23]